MMLSGKSATWQNGVWQNVVWRADAIPQSGEREREMAYFLIESFRKWHKLISYKRWGPNSDPKWKMFALVSRSQLSSSFERAKLHSVQKSAKVSFLHLNFALEVVSVVVTLMALKQLTLEVRLQMTVINFCPQISALKY